MAQSKYKITLDMEILCTCRDIDRIFEDLCVVLMVCRSTAYGVSTSSGYNLQKEGSSSYTDELKYFFFANQSSGPQLDHEDLEQVDEFDLKEMDLKWQVAMISMRLKKFYKKTGRRLQFDAKEPVGFIKTKFSPHAAFYLFVFYHDNEITNQRREEEERLVTKTGVEKLKSLEVLQLLRDKKGWLALSDMDAVRVCLLIIAELVFMGKNDRNCIPRHIVSLVEDLDAWNDYLWGEYMWNKFYKRTMNVVAIHQDHHLAEKKKNLNFNATYNLYGFAWAFKILETYPNNQIWWSKKEYVLPRGLVWTKISKFEKSDYDRLFGPVSFPNVDLYSTPAEKREPWFIASIPFIKGLVDEDKNVFPDDCVGVSKDNVVDGQHQLGYENERVNETLVEKNDLLLLEERDGVLDSEGGGRNHESSNVEQQENHESDNVKQTANHESDNVKQPTNHESDNVNQQANHESDNVNQPANVLIPELFVEVHVD
ncbi:phospholipase-like protein [Tanacetum coccineum]